MTALRRAGRWGLVATAIALHGAAHAQLTQRLREPIVLTGSALPTLLGAPPSRIVAFSYDGGWVQTAVQVDERALVDFGTILHGAPTGLKVLTYTDDGTWTGADPDPTFDADDEITFVSGGAAAAPGDVVEPVGTVAGSGVRLTVTDPLSAEQGFLYLFVSDGTLDPAAGTPPIAYTFNLLSGSYKTSYSIAFGPNPENSTVVTPSYTVHFSDRWVRDGTSVTRDGASGVDILDRHAFEFSPGVCTRTEDTFSAGQGAFIFNRSGPVRALRGYVGANSGTTTYRTHAFYEVREEITTVLRVHNIPGMVDFFDYAPAAAGMTYRDSVNMNGVQIDGTPDTVAHGAYSWQMVTGAQGTLVHIPVVTTDIPNFAYSNYYIDDRNVSPHPCTGDATYYGASGFQTGALPNTDPALGTANSFTLKDVIVYGAPNHDANYAVTVNSRVRQPLLVSSATPASLCPDADHDGHSVCGGVCLLDDNEVCGDCNDGNGQVFSPPVEVAGVVVRTVAGATHLSWSGQDLSAGAATTYDVVSGAISSLAQFSGFGGAGCLTASGAGASFDDPRPLPAPGTGYYYLVRARNACAVATFGHSSLVPDPRATLDASSICN